MDARCKLWLPLMSVLALAVLVGCEWPQSRRSSEKVLFQFEGVDKTKLARTGGKEDAWAPLDPSGIPQPTGAPQDALDAYTYRVPERRVLYYTNPFWSHDSTSIYEPWGPTHIENTHYEETWEVSPYFAVERREPKLPDGDAAVNFDVEASQADVTGGTASVRVRIAAPGSTGGKVEGLNLAIVLDLSRSLEQPEKLALVRAAAHHLVDQLMPGDRFALVAFGSEAQLLLAAQDPAERALLHRRIEELMPRGEGNMAAGLLAGFDEVEAGLELSSYSGHVILISDGLSGRGGTDAWRYGEMARRMHAQKGIRTSTVAVGRNADPGFLSVLAREGEGRFAYARGVEEIPHLLGDQLRNMFKVYARNVRLRVKTPNGVEVEGVYGSSLRGAVGGVKELMLGEFAAGEERSLLFRLRIPEERGHLTTQFLLHFERVDPERRTRYERDVHFPTGKNASVDTYARLVLGLDQIRRALEGRQDVTAASVADMYDAEFPSLRAAAVTSGDREVIRQAQLFERFAQGLRRLVENGRLGGQSVEREELLQDFYYRS